MFIPKCYIHYVILSHFLQYAYNVSINVNIRKIYFRNVFLLFKLKKKNS